MIGMKKSIEKNKNHQNNTKANRRVSIFTIIGIILTIVNFIIYTFLANIIFQNNNFLWLSTLISTTISTFLAYFLHSKITWKERKITKSAKYKFFIWNFLTAVIINPFFTQLFSLFSPLYKFAFNIFSTANMQFSYEFIQSTGAFALTACVTMVLNYLFYDRFVFDKNKLTE